MRSKYGQYDEYHTSLDDLSLVTPTGLQGGLDMLAHAIRVMELTDTWRATVPGEPQMGRRGLYPTTSTRTSGRGVRDMMNVLAYLDGTNDTMDLAAITGLTVVEVAAIAQQLVEAGVAERVEGAAPR